MPEPFILKKAFDFSITALGKSASMWIKGGVVLLAVFFFVIGIKSCAKKPLPTQSAQGDANIYNLQPHAFGCARLIIPIKKK